MLGGFVTSVYDEGQSYSVKRTSMNSWHLPLCTGFPPADLQARAALPDMVSHKDAVYNLSRAALLPPRSAMAITACLAWQPRIPATRNTACPVIDGGDEMFELAQDLGALAVYISGAGPTIMAVVPRDDQEFFARAQEALPQSEKLKPFYRLPPAAR